MAKDWWNNPAPGDTAKAEALLDKETESPDSDPHVHTVAESAPWWAEAFPQWKGKGRNG